MHPAVALQWDVGIESMPRFQRRAGQLDGRRRPATPRRSSRPSTGSRKEPTSPSPERTAWRRRPHENKGAPVALASTGRYSHARANTMVPCWRQVRPLSFLLAADALPAGHEELQFELTAIFWFAMADSHGVDLDRDQDHVLLTTDDFEPFRHGPRELIVVEPEKPAAAQVTGFRWLPGS